MSDTSTHHKGQDNITTIIAAFRSALPDPHKPFSLLNYITVRDGEQQRIIDAFAKSRKGTLKDKGVIVFHLNQETNDPTRFAVYERWESLADLETHLRTPHVTELLRELEPIMSKAPEFHVLLPVDE